MSEIKLSDSAKSVLEARYLKKNEKGEVVEKPEDMFRRVAENIASAELVFNKDANTAEVATRFYDIMIKRLFQPNSPTLMNAGRDLQQLSACFVLPVGDSMGEIFKSISDAALIHKSGGGTGFSFSRLRPKNDSVRSTSGVSSGPVSFMKVFNTATEVIKQGGTRRGANMGILRVDHPDILEFISAKDNLQELNNFNISVAITDSFMKAYEAGEKYPLINPRDGKIVEEIDANDVFNLLVNHAWNSGEPGIIFIDRINENNPTPALGEMESTNPCGEQPLLPYEACNLGSLNLALMYKDGGLNYELLGETIETAVRFLDNVIEMNEYPIDAIEERVRGNRKIGLGVMGFADLLFQMEIAYDSEEAEKLGGEIMKFIQEKGREASGKLAEERGVFPNYGESVYAKKNMKLRNATVTTIAPTGTISIISGASGGIEPVFALSFIRNVLDGKELVEVNPIFEEIAKREGFYSEVLAREVAEKGGVSHVSAVPQKWRNVFKTSHDISPEWHLRIQSAFQKYTDNAVSKTINFPHNATVHEIKEAYLLAYKLKCKGVTVYRDGSRQAQVLNIGKVNKEKEEEVAVEEDVVVSGHVKPRVRPKMTSGSTLKIPTACGNLYVTINEDSHGLCEVFATIGKSGGCAASQAEAISRMLSLALRSGIAVNSVVKQLRGIRCTSPIWSDGEMVLSCPDAIGRAIDLYLENREESIPIKDIKVSAKKKNQSETHTPSCPECSSPMDMSEGCMKCSRCGYSKCD